MSSLIGISAVSTTIADARRRRRTDDAGNDATSHGLSPSRLTSRWLYDACAIIGWAINLRKRPPLPVNLSIFRGHVMRNVPSYGRLEMRTEIRDYIEIWRTRLILSRLDDKATKILSKGWTDIPKSPFIHFIKIFMKRLLSCNTSYIVISYGSYNLWCL